MTTMEIWYDIVLSISAIGWGFLVRHSWRMSRRSAKAELRLNLMKMGSPVGKTFEEVIGYLGQPKSKNISKKPDGHTEVKWRGGDYQVSLTYDENNVCIGSGDETVNLLFDLWD